MTLKVMVRLGAWITGAAWTVSLGGVLSGGVAAAPSAASLDSQIASALDRIEAGTWTHADIELIRSVPEVAAQVPDPSRPAETVAVTSSGTPQSSRHATAESALATICGAWVDVWFQKVSVLGNSIFKWHHYVRYCRNGNVVTSWQNRYDYLTDAQSGVYFRELEVDAQWGIGTNNATSHIQRHVEFCVVKFGCYENHHPWSRITVHGNGTYDWTGASG